MPVKPLYADALSAGSYAAIIVDGSGLIYRNDGQPAEVVNTANGALYQIGKAAADAIGNWSSAVPTDLPASVLDYRVLLFSVAGSNLNLATDGLPVREGSLSWMGNAVGEATIQRANNQGQTTNLPTTGAPTVGQIDAQLSGTHGSGSWSATAAGPGLNPVTITWTDSVSGLPVTDGGLWVTTDQAGQNVVAGTFLTSPEGKVTFLLTAGATYYLWGESPSVNPLVARQFIAVAD